MALRLDDVMAMQMGHYLVLSKVSDLEVEMGLQLEKLMVK